MRAAGLGGVSNRSRVELFLALVNMDLSQLTRRSIVIKVCIDCTVDYPGLEAGVVVAERHRGSRCNKDTFVL